MNGAAFSPGVHEERLEKGSQIYERWLNDSLDMRNMIRYRAKSLQPLHFGNLCSLRLFSIVLDSAETVNSK